MHAIFVPNIVKIFANKNMYFNKSEKSLKINNYNIIEPFGMTCTLYCTLYFEHSII